MFALELRMLSSEFPLSPEFPEIRWRLRTMAVPVRSRRMKTEIFFSGRLRSRWSCFEGHVLCSFNQSRKALSILVCQPLPVALKLLSTSGDKRILTAFLGLSETGRPIFTRNSSSGIWLTGFIFLIISAVKTVPSATACRAISCSSIAEGSMVFFLSFGINIYLSVIGFAQAENPNRLDVL